VLNQATACAAVPPGLAATAVSASLNFAAGSITGPAAAVALKEIQAMFVKKLVLGAALGLVSVSVLGAGGWYAPDVIPAAKAKAKADKDALQGEWTVVKSTIGGRDEGAVGKPMTITADQLKLTGKADVAYTIDPTPKLKTIDLEVKDGPDNGKDTMRGVYELNGDRLTLHFARAGQERPTTLEPKAGEDTMLMVLERVKK
jgi:uncharacterized protein (TIGR03067 family)